MDAPELTQTDKLAVDIDLRLSVSGHWPIWLEPGTPLARVMERSEIVRDMVGAIARTAYAQGYIDALREDKDGRRAELHRTHGYRPE
jgi:hypothetical protein